MIANQQIQQYFSNMARAQELLLEYLDSDTNSEEDFNKFFDNLKNIVKKKWQFKAFIYLISTISNHHHRNNHFISKIERILLKLQKTINLCFSNSKIFNLFKKNKLILLFLYEQKIITLEEKMFDGMPDNYKMKYFFAPEIEYKYNDLYKKNPEQFYENRKIGENELHFCKIIRDDLINDFESFVNKKQLDLSSEIPESVFETNLFLMKKKPTIIEYAAFFGSFQIFKYLYEQKVKVSSSIWLYAIHGQNKEILNYLQKNLQVYDIIEKCIKELIKCHDNQTVIFFYNNLLLNEKKSTINLYTTCLNSYNFSFFTNEISKGIVAFNEFFKNYCENYETKLIDIFFYLCKKDYFNIVDILYKINKNNLTSNIIMH